MSIKPTVNITPIERASRILVGILGTIGGLYLLTGAGSVVAVVLEVLLLLAGLDMIVTGSTGHCPLYKRLGHMPASLQGRTS